MYVYDACRGTDLTIAPFFPRHDNFFEQSDQETFLGGGGGGIAHIFHHVNQLFW